MKTVVSETSESPTPPATWLASILAKQNPAWLARYVAFRRRIQHMTQGKRRWLLKRAAVSVTGAALLLALSQAPTAHAATITVDNGVVAVADDGQCSLPEAILNANLDSQFYTSPGECAPGSGPDTITLSGSTYTLTTVDNTAYYSDNGLPLIESDITIDGNGATIERDNAAPDFRLMAVTGSGSLKLNDTTMTYGYSQEDGGALYVANGGYALITGSTFTYNRADEGGAIQSEGELIIDSSLIETNYASDDGGGVSSEDGGDLTIRNGTIIRDNRARDSGGGVEADDGPLTITDSTIRVNYAEFGGGIETEYSTVTISNSTIRLNTADAVGGGIAAYKATVTIENGSVIGGNYAYGYGGGADLYLSDVTISDSEISGNTAYYEGGGIHSDGSYVYISGSLIDQNIVPPDQGFTYGGGIAATYGYDDDTQTDVPGLMVIIDSTISGNTAAIGGGVYNTYYSSLYIVRSTISNNQAYYGGGLLNFGGRWIMVNSTVSGNRAGSNQFPDGGGGGIFNISSSSGEPDALLYNSTVTGNEANVYGGGIAHVYGAMLLGGNVISGNTAGEVGSEIYNDDVLLADSYNIMGHGGETNADAFEGFTPGVNDLNLTSDYGNIPLTDILETTLAANGGPTLTHALVSGSPAIDFVPSDYCDNHVHPARRPAQLPPQHRHPRHRQRHHRPVRRRRVRSAAAGRQLLPGRPRVRHGGQRTDHHSRRGHGQPQPQPHGGQNHRPQRQQRRRPVRPDGGQGVQWRALRPLHLR